MLIVDYAQARSRMESCSLDQEFGFLASTSCPGAVGQESWTGDPSQKVKVLELLAMKVGFLLYFCPFLTFGWLILS